MKRNEAVNIIANHIYECGLDSEEATIEAESILDKLQEAGMCPPMRCICPEKAQYITSYTHTWEPEDD